MHFLGPADKFKAEDVGGIQVGVNAGINAGIASIGLGFEYSPASKKSPYSMLTRSACIGIGPAIQINGSKHVEGFSVSIGVTYVDDEKVFE